MAAATRRRDRWIAVDPMVFVVRREGTIVPLPAFLGFASLGVGARAVPVIASVVLHASLAVGLVATAAGHSRAPAASPTATITVDVETLDTRDLSVPPPVAPVAAAVPPPPVAHDDPPATHTHPYPVDPSHDARPHDPSLHHDEASPPDLERDHDHDDRAEPAAAAPAVVAPAAALPSFDMTNGAGAPTGVHVAMSGKGTGGGAAMSVGASTAPNGNDDVVHAASTVQVAARLVQSVVAAYPVHARADEVEGDVGVEIVVDREGRVVDARVTRPAGHGLDEAALTAVRAYRFSPAQREGRAVRVRMPWSVQFRLR
jgi:protein TonB